MWRKARSVGRLAMRSFRTSVGSVLGDVFSVHQGVGETRANEASIGGDGVVEGRGLGGSWPPRTRWTSRSWSRRSMCARWCSCGFGAVLRRRAQCPTFHRGRCRRGRPTRLGFSPKTRWTARAVPTLELRSKTSSRRNGPYPPSSWLVSSISEHPRDGRKAPIASVDGIGGQDQRPSRASPSGWRA